MALYRKNASEDHFSLAKKTLTQTIHRLLLLNELPLKMKSAAASEMISRASIRARNFSLRVFYLHVSIDVFIY